MYRLDSFGSCSVSDSFRFHHPGTIGQYWLRVWGGCCLKMWKTSESSPPTQPLILGKSTPKTQIFQHEHANSLALHVSLKSGCSCLLFFVPDHDHRLWSSMKIVKVDICKYSMSLTGSASFGHRRLHVKNNPMSEPAVPGQFHIFSATTGAPELSQNAKFRLHPVTHKGNYPQVMALPLFSIFSNLCCSLLVQL